MKRLLLLIAFALAFGGCKKEETKEQHVFDNAELLSSVWSEDNISQFVKNASISINISGDCRYSYTSLLFDEPRLVDLDLDYVYKKPNIVFKYKNGELWGEGTISENGDEINDKIIDLGEKGTFTCYKFDGVYDFIEN